MKKNHVKSTIFKFASIALLTAAIFVSCKKDSNVQPTGKVENPVSADLYQEKLNSLSSKYLSDHSASSGSFKPPKWLRVLGADLKGALAGGATGAAAGSVIPGVGSAAGSVVGAAVGGAAASIEKAEASSIVAPFPGGFNPTGNSNNSENQVGLEHYLCIDAAAASQSNYKSSGVYDNSVFYSFSNNFYVTSGLISSGWSQAFTLTMSNSNLSLIAANPFLTESQFATLLYDDSKISAAVKDALIPYFECLDAAPSVEDFTEYSIEAEDIITQSTSLSAQDKKLILIVMATGRNGIQYWSEF